jgi:regulator of extracellular matrix RemA (YlzA/DUF370 family)
MSSMSIASFVFILISILSFTYRLSDNKVKILYTCFILSVLSPFLGSISEVYSSELLPLIIMPCCVVLSCLYNEMRSMRVSILALLLMLFSVQNIMSSSSYLFIVLIESAAVLSLLSEDHKDKQIIELSYASFVRVILLISLFVLSSINLIPVANLIEYSFGLGFIFFNSLSFNGKIK